MDLTLTSVNAPSDPRARITEIDDAIAAIKAQIATADLERQRYKRPIDPRWFHAAKTAMRHLQRERAELRGTTVPRRHRQMLNDCVIAVLRERYDDTTWSAIVSEAHRRLCQELQ